MPFSSDPTTCLEKQLLVCCARTRLTPDIAERIRELVAQPLDWDYLLAEARENSVTPLLERQLRAVASDSVPSAQFDRLKSACRSNTVRCLFLAAELTTILGHFLSQEIPAIPYKGPVLAAQAYGDVTLREFEDLDIIVRQRDLPRAHEVILGMGYHAKFRWILSPGAASSLVPGEYNYRDEARRVLVDLHTELTLRHFPVVPNLDDYMQRLVPVSICGREIRTFSPEDLLTALCIHGSKDFWERLSWIADIAEVLDANQDLDWAGTLKKAQRLNAQRMVHLGLALACDLLDAKLPKEIFRQVRADHVAASVAAHVEHRLLSREWRPLNGAGRARFRRRMLPGAFAGWRYFLRLAIVPAEEDWLMMRLPRPLGPLYVALRPLRLLQKYGWTSRRA
jgi:hypothetical protein